MSVIDHNAPPETRLDPGPGEGVTGVEGGLPVTHGYAFVDPANGHRLRPVEANRHWLAWKKTARKDMKVLYQLFEDMETGDEIWMPVPTFAE